MPPVSPELAFQHHHHQPASGACRPSLPPPVLVTYAAMLQSAYA